jgi:hypothetical protein
VSALVPGFRPNGRLERRLLADPELREGLAWGHPRFGHPEGPVGCHVALMVRRIPSAHPLRRELRLLALIHDSFKYRVDAGQPYGPDNDHACLARRFAERYVADERLLMVLQLHDEPYWIWRHGAEESAVSAVLERTPDPVLFVAFVELDAASPGKDPTFLYWFRRVLRTTLAADLAA